MGVGRGRLIEGCRNKIQRCTVVSSVNWRCRFTKIFAIIFLKLEIYYIVPKIDWPQSFFFFISYILHVFCVCCFHLPL